MNREQPQDTTLPQIETSNPYASPQAGRGRGALADPPEILERRIAQGQRMLRILASVISGLSVLDILGSMLFPGSGMLISQLLRFAVIAGLIWGIYTGHAWARVLAAVIFGLIALGAACQPFMLGARVNPFILVFSEVYALCFAGFVVALLGSKSVDRFLWSEEQRKKQFRRRYQTHSPLIACPKCGRPLASPGTSCPQCGPREDVW